MDTHLDPMVFPLSPEPNRLRVTWDTSDEGFLYLAGVMDAWSRNIVGWSMSDSLHATVALDALRMEVARRNPPRGVVHHSDRGVQYACRECRDLLDEHGMAQSMSRSGDCYDNAMMESLWATLKKELVHGRRFRTHEEARLAVFEWIARSGTSQRGSTAHSATSAPRHSRRPRGPDRIKTGVHGACGRST